MLISQLPVNKSYLTTSGTIWESLFDVFIFITKCDKRHNKNTSYFLLQKIPTRARREHRQIVLGCRKSRKKINCGRVGPDIYQLRKLTRISFFMLCFLSYLNSVKEYLSRGHSVKFRNNAVTIPVTNAVTNIN